jgi:hypothetical protein
MRDKLVELIKRGGVIIPQTAEAVADYLIANNVFVLPDELENNLELTAKFLMGLFLNSEEEIEKTKEIFEFSQTKKILTDIRDYLVTEKGRVANSDIYLLQIQAVEKFADKALADLTDYAEKLGVEL